MYEWNQQIQKVIDDIDKNLLEHNEDALTLNTLSKKLGYSEFYTTRKFKEISGMQFKDYLRLRKLTFALKEVRDTNESLINIAMNYGFSSHEAFTRAFKSTYGITPKAYRKNPKPLVLRTKINAFDRYSFGLNELGMIKSTTEVKVYFITIPAHKFVYIQNYESSGFFDFWRKQNQIPGQDYGTICGLFDSLKGKLDDVGETIPNSASGQIMAYIYNPKGRTCEWGFPRTECWGARLPASYKGEIPDSLEMIDVSEAD